MTERLSYSDYALVDLLDAFASNEPVPGGGSASALAGALGVSLLIMVAGLPKTRNGTPEEAADLSQASSRLRPLRDALLGLVDRDSDAYRSLLQAFRLPRHSEPEQRAREEAIDVGTRTITEVPLETMRACQQALAGAVVVARNGHVAAASDAAVAVELLVAAVRGCALNIEINLTGVESAYRASVEEERRQLETDAGADADRARALLAIR